MDLLIKSLEVTVYPPSGWGYKTNSMKHPSWSQVESAIRDLDHHCHPFIFLGLRDECEDVDCMTILGGKNGYAISVGDSVGRWSEYVDPSHTGGEVPVWTSDQGYYPSERYVTYDLELVIKIARHYSESGERFPEVEWED